METNINSQNTLAEKSVKILNKYDNIVEYELTIGFKGIVEKFATRDSFMPYSQISAEKIYGPFNHLNSRWDFEKISDNKTKISFFIDFSIKSGLLSFILSPFFKEAASLMIEAFEQRAGKLNT